MIDWPLKAPAPGRLSIRVIVKLPSGTGEIVVDVQDAERQEAITMVIALLSATRTEEPQR